MKPKPIQPKAKRLEGDEHNAYFHRIESGQMPMEEARAMVKLHPELAPALDIYIANRAVKVKTRTIYVKSESQSRPDFPSYEAASEYADTLIPKSCDGNRDGDDGVRVRVRRRSRTGLWDVVVKIAKEVPVTA